MKPQANPFSEYLRSESMRRMEEQEITRITAFHLERLAPGKGVKMWEEYQQSNRKQK